MMLTNFSVYPHDPKNSRSDSTVSITEAHAAPGNAEERQGQDVSRIPIVNASLAVFASIAAFFGLSSSR